MAIETALLVNAFHEEQEQGSGIVSEEQELVEDNALGLLFLYCFQEIYEKALLS